MDAHFDAKRFPVQAAEVIAQRGIEEPIFALQVQPDWEKFLNERKVDCVLAPTAGSLANILKETPTWNLIYEDRTAVLFQKIK